MLRTLLLPPVAGGAGVLSEVIGPCGGPAANPTPLNFYAVLRAAGNRDFHRTPTLDARTPAAHLGHGNRICDSCRNLHKNAAASLRRRKHAVPAGEDAGNTDFDDASEGTGEEEEGEDREDDVPVLEAETEGGNGEDDDMGGAASLTALGASGSARVGRRVSFTRVSAPLAPGDVPSGVEVTRSARLAVTSPPSKLRGSNSSPTRTDMFTGEVMDIRELASTPGTNSRALRSALPRASTFAGFDAPVAEEVPVVLRRFSTLRHATDALYELVLVRPPACTSWRKLHPAGAPR